MSAPKQFNITAPVRATEIPAKRERSVDHGPNLFLEPHPESGFPHGYLMESYEQGAWFDLPVEGGWEVGEVTKGPNKGQEVDRLYGDAVEVSRQLREAATALSIGVSIKTFPVLFKSGAKKGQEDPTRILIKYLGQKRKAPRKPKTETVTVE